MNQFAKIFEVINHQLLVTKESDEGEHTIKARALLDVGDIAVSFGYETKKERDDNWENFNEDTAELTLIGMIDLINNEEDE